MTRARRRGQRGHGFADEPLRAAVDRVVTADGLIAVTPVFSSSYSGLFRTFFDVVDEEALAGLPVLVAATAGTARHSLVLEHAMRPLFAYLRAVVVPTVVFAAPEDWGRGGTATRTLSGRAERAAFELASLVSASRRARRPTPSPSRRRSSSSSRAAERFGSPDGSAGRLWT